MDNSREAINRYSKALLCGLHVHSDEPLPVIPMHGRVSDDPLEQPFLGREPSTTTLLQIRKSRGIHEHVFAIRVSTARTLSLSY